MVKVFILFLGLILAMAAGASFASAQLETVPDNAAFTTYEADSYRDPLMPQIEKEITKAQEVTIEGAPVEEVKLELNVQGMVWNSDKPEAIIEGQVFQLGDEIREAKIIEITKDGVKLLYKGKIITAKPRMALETSR